jgi:hypothetical protein
MAARGTDVGVADATVENVEKNVVRSRLAAFYLERSKR